MLEFISAAVRAAGTTLPQQFAAAQPFRHLVIDDFLEPSFATDLMREFPAFERGNNMGEDGKPGQKATVEHMHRLGPSYARLDQLIQSTEFLSLLGRITGISGLLHDPWYTGGGTHENRHGATLSPHIDFNFHPLEGWHRRLNLIIYLNPEWKQEWGGQLGLYSDPYRDAQPDCSIVPMFNRCVIFETTESSWHGFDRITLPETDPHLGRKSIALYFYTNQALPTAPGQVHSTVYVGDRLPPHFSTGHTLTSEDMTQLLALVSGYDQRMRFQYDEIARLMTLVRAHEQGMLGTAMYIIRKLGQRIRRS